MSFWLKKLGNICSGMDTILKYKFWLKIDKHKARVDMDVTSEMDVSVGGIKFEEEHNFATWHVT